MKRCVLRLVVLILVIPNGLAIGEDITVTGAGASFPFPVYSKWAHKYGQLTGVKLNYQPIGSGGGIAQIKAKTVNFGASDAPMDSEELKDLGLTQFPMVVGGVVPVVNLKGVQAGQLHLTGALLADIFLGKIKNWNDDAIKKVNPNLNLPDKTITVVHRADGSGTTWIYTHYLSKVSNEWKDKVGCSKAISWPTGVGGKLNAGVASYVQRIDGAIGYVEYAYALQNKLTFPLLQNRAGKFVAPELKTFQAAAVNADWKNAAEFAVVLTDQAGDDTWPIAGASFILIYKMQNDAAMGKAVLKFFDWCYRHGSAMAEELHYVPLPMNVVELVEDAWKKEVGTPLWP